MPTNSGDRIPFNRPALIGTEADYVREALERQKFSGVGPFGRRCNRWLRTTLDAPAALTVSSGTHALEMAALLCGVGPDDEVILPSFAFPTTASAFARCGARLVFVDVVPQTMNIDPAAVAQAITPRTRVIVALHYAGIPCDMKALLELARANGLLVVEDAAHALLSTSRGCHCGTMGDLGCISFHETKNIQCGEGGALVVNRPELVDRAEIILEKGTDRTRFFRGEVDRYTWQDLGSSYVMGELQAAFLLAQLESAETIVGDRHDSWEAYHEALSDEAAVGTIEIARLPEDCRHNGHLFWIKLRDEEHRSALIADLDQQGVHAVFHYVPLHSSPAGTTYGRFSGVDRHTTRDAARLLRLPLFFGFRSVDRVVAAIRRSLAT